MLRKATNRHAYAKIGIYGTAGAGKTFTASQIAIGLHKAIKSTKPVAIFDTEPAFGFVLPKFEKAGIEVLIQDESRAFVDLMTFMDEAEAVSDIVIIDSITHVWRDLQGSFMAQINKRLKARNKPPIAALEFHHWKPIKDEWARFSDRFLSSKLHIILCGRAGTIYEYQEKSDGSGKRELISTGHKMATEKELGHEPSLLIEMVREQRDGKTYNVAVVEKDRSDNLNGDEIPRPTYESFKPFFDALNLGGEHFGSMEERTSEGSFKITDESGWDREKQNRTILSEEILELLRKHHPGQTEDAKKTRGDLMEMFFDTRSWTKISEATPADQLRVALADLRNHLEPQPKQEAA